MNYGESTRRRHTRRELRGGDTTPEASKRSSRTSHRSGISTGDTREARVAKKDKAVIKSTLCSELIRVLLHLIVVFLLILSVICLFEYNMLHFINWEHPKREDPLVHHYHGASFITKDFDCSILARRCYMAKRRLRTCFVPALICISLLRPDMFPPGGRGDKEFYISMRHLSSALVDHGKKKEVFRTLHARVKRENLLSYLRAYNETFLVPYPGSKGMPKDDQLFLIPWEIAHQEDKYKQHLEYLDLNLDDTPDVMRPRHNTDARRRDWIRSMNVALANKTLSGNATNHWRRPTNMRRDLFRVDTVPGFTGALTKRIIDAAMLIMDSELAHSERKLHPFTDDTLLLIYRHVLIYALRNPLLMMFNQKRWRKRTRPFDPMKIAFFNDTDGMATLTGESSSISFLFGGHSPRIKTRMPDILAVTISEAKAQLGGRDFELSVPVRIASGVRSIDIVSSSGGERAFHANIITALRVLLRLRLSADSAVEPTFNDILHLPIAFYSMAEHKMIFDDYKLVTSLRDILCKDVEACATPYDQTSTGWNERFNGTTAIQYRGTKKQLSARIDQRQDRRNYAVGY